MQAWLLGVCAAAGSVGHGLSNGLAFGAGAALVLVLIAIGIRRILLAS